MVIFYCMVHHRELPRRSRMTKVRKIECLSYHERPLLLLIRIYNPTLNSEFQNLNSSFRFEICSGFTLLSLVLCLYPSISLAFCPYPAADQSDCNY